ncbi:fumarylacetoacetate hydrolase family protein [Halalkalibacter wakoensis JCM 9140]|uniref:Fumarylacetoacetate hydrolase family protein n=1 Tax=Halalkalibacter wakoensis JCM 9140 TaxID=1236970 RepID=W4Q105_9BACI|nr:fumarylacetoacetate hydrolase family protein [Halalkalibacter wakoensis]GAE25625.1 fumarylacetoacetate hydrolase family protein [Halalkalibacter wakoensis JCM 9140]
MHFITYELENKSVVGLKINDQAVHIQALAKHYEEEEIPSYLENMKTIIEAGEEALAYINQLKEYYVTNKKVQSVVSTHLDDVKWRAPIENPGKVVCVGNNYMDHCIEQNVEPPKQPLIFSKWPSCLIANGEEIELPEESKQVDFEAELAVVIGKKGKHISEEEAVDYIFGYTIMNDVSARDVQFGDGQWVRGKSFDTFAPLGPVLVSKDEITDPQNLDIKLTVNDTVYQDSNTKQMIFSIPYIIAYLSKGFTFEPGDIVATGTPHGVGVFRNPAVFLQKGDVCSIEIDQIGTLQNKVNEG